MQTTTKKLLFGLGFLSVFLFSFTNAEDNSLVDEVNKKDDIQQSLQLNFQNFSSCEDAEKVLGDFLKNFPKRPMPLYRYGLLEGNVDEAKMETTAPQSINVAGGIAADKGENINSSNTDFSKTNNQKENVDEPEILKTNGKYLFYYNRKNQKVDIIQSPLDLKTAKINIKNAKIINSINIPKSFSNTKLFLNNDKLVIIGSRYNNNLDEESILSRYNRTSVAIYDISNPTKLKLLKFTDIDGYFKDSRMIGDNLFVVSNVHVNRRYRADLKREKKHQIRTFLPSAYDINLGGKKNITKVASDCKKISYLLPNKQTIKQLNLHPSFTVVTAIDTKNILQKSTTNIILSANGQMHTTKDSFYFTNNIWTYNDFKCPFGSRCIIPSFENGNQTLIHKFAIQNRDLQYKATNIVRGSFLNQYSMDEDKDGNFRILTRQNRANGTNLYVLNKDLDLQGKLEKIEPKEQFKASRYIGDKLFLVTFKQTDPLFVIDLKKSTDPKIIGELKIPGFSTYLHPLSKEGSKQYLAGLGYSANDKGRREGLQLSLYEIDYDKKETAKSKCSWLDGEKFQKEYKKCLTEVNTGNIFVSMLSTKTLGSIGSSSEAMRNPRMFVMDKNQNITLPMILQKQIKDGERCSVYRDSNGVETKENCYPITRQKTNFAGLKSFNFDVNKGISEVYSVDYLPIYTKLYNSNDEDWYVKSWQIRNLMSRVGYLGDVIYMINNDFAHFSIPNYKNSQYIYFNEELNDSK